MVVYCIGIVVYIVFFVNIGIYDIIGILGWFLVWFFFVG